MIKQTYIYVFALIGTGLIGMALFIVKDTSTEKPSVFSNKYNETGKHIYKTQIKPAVRQNGYPTEQTYYRAYQAGETKPWVSEKEFKHFKLPGIIEKTRYPYQKPTKENLVTGYRIYNKSFEFVERRGYFNYSKAVEDGYTFEWSPRHSIPANNISDLEIGTSSTFNESHPYALMYYPTPKGDEKELVGVMWQDSLGSSPHEHHPQPAGRLFTWHYHPLDWWRTSNYHIQYVRDLVEQNNTIDSAEEWFSYHSTWNATLREYEEVNFSPPMAHMWFIKRDDGPFSPRESVPLQKVKKPNKMNKSEFIDYANKSILKYQNIILNKSAKLNLDKHKKWCRRTECSNDSFDALKGDPIVVNGSLPEPYNNADSTVGDVFKK